MADTRRTLAGRYQIGSALGEGGMAKVFRGTDEVLGRTVAIKVLAPEFARDQQFVDRFRREAQAAAGLNHPNVVSVFDTGSENGVHFIVMEHIEGRTLREVLREEGPLHPERAAEVTEAVCRALDSAHQQGLVHRDVKPGNVMLTPQGAVKVMDFGIARATSGEALTQTATVLGTASYFSPEQAKGEPVDRRSDIYSVGCVLYELVTGRPPFAGDSPVTIAYKHVREEPELPSAINSHVSPGLEAVIMKALAKNPANRYQGATDMAQDLARARQGVPVTATPILPGDATQVVTRAHAGDGTAVMEPLHEDGEPGRSKTWLVVLASALTLGLLGVAAFFLIRELTSGPPLVGVPKVTGLTEQQATKRLRDLGFSVRPNHVADAAAKGTVIDQDPAPGTQAREGSPVLLRVSAGPKPTEVPSLEGKTVDEARADLEAAGLKLGSVKEEESDVTEGTIIRQSPEAGDQVKPGKEVNVVISKGITSRIVPNVVCREEEDAKALLEDQDLKMKVAGEEPSDACPEPGTIARQQPAAGETVEKGSRVRVWRSTGPKEETPTPSPSPVLPTP